MTRHCRSLARRVGVAGIGSNLPPGRRACRRPGRPLQHRAVSLRILGMPGSGRAAGHGRRVLRALRSSESHVDFVQRRHRDVARRELLRAEEQRRARRCGLSRGARHAQHRGWAQRPRDPRRERLQDGPVATVQFADACPGKCTAGGCRSGRCRRLISRVCSRRETKAVARYDLVWAHLRAASRSRPRRRSRAVAAVAAAGRSQHENAGRLHDVRRDDELRPVRLGIERAWVSLCEQDPKRAPWPAMRPSCSTCAQRRETSGSLASSPTMPREPLRARRAPHAHQDKNERDLPRAESYPPPSRFGVPPRGACFGGLEAQEPRAARGSRA